MTWPGLRPSAAAMQVVQSVLAAALLFVAKEEITSEPMWEGQLGWLVVLTEARQPQLGLSSGMLSPIALPSATPLVQTARGMCCLRERAAGRAKWLSPKPLLRASRSVPVTIARHACGTAASCPPKF